MINYEELSDEELFKELRIGNHAAFTAIFNRYWEMLLNSAFKRLGDKEMAEELTQEIFVNFYLRRERISVETSLKSYLNTALKYKVIDVYRANNLHQHKLDLLSASYQNRLSNTSDTLELKELRKQIIDAAQTLPERCREVFMLSRFDELTHQEIADRLDISIDTVKSHLNRALKIVKKRLNANWPDTFLILYLGYQVIHYENIRF